MMEGVKVLERESNGKSYDHTITLRYNKHEVNELTLCLMLMKVITIMKQSIKESREQRYKQHGKSKYDRSME